jgi:hypothetical protein
VGVIILSTVMMCLGTAWAFLPGSGRAGDDD